MLAVLIFAACNSTGPDHSSRTVSVDARFYNGATSAASTVAARTMNQASINAAATASLPIAAQAVPQLCTTGAQCWFLTPDRVTMTLTTIQPVLSSGDPTETIAVDCLVTYDNTKPGLTQLADCPFSLPPGTYSGFTLFVSPTMQVTVNDAAAGFYSTSTGIVRAAPAGGAQPLSVTIGTTNGNELQEPNVLPSAVQVSDSTPITFSVVVNGIQSLKVATTASGVVLGWPGTSYTDTGRPDWAVAVGSLASVAFYSNQGIGTAGSFCAGGCVSPTGVQSVTVYFANSNTPEMVAIPINGLPKGCGPFGLSWIVDKRSYLGLDGAGNVSWAIPTDATYSAWAVEMQMPQVTALGASTTLYCKNITSDPAPSGGSFSSGAPGIATAAYSIGTFVLLAH